MNARARKFSALLRKRAQDVGQEAIAKACTVDTATISRWFSEGKIDQFCVAIESMGCKILPLEFKCVRNQEELDHLLFWARKGMESVKSAADLIFEEESE